MQAQSFGDQLRTWRQRRRLSQLALASEAGVSTRHLSFVETGRAAPSRDMVLQLCGQLDLPLRERNALLLAAGFAPRYSEHGLDHPDLASARAALDVLLNAHAPNPALAVDRHWTLVAANSGAMKLMEGLDPSLLAPPLNVLRISLHPSGLAPRIANLNEWRGHVFARLDRQIHASADPVLMALLEELRAYPGGAGPAANARGSLPVITPLRLHTAAGLISFVSFTTLLGAPHDVMLDELAIETFIPADPESAKRLATFSV
jgi:transcriptional regulator with XRE-family HTH domain